MKICAVCGKEISGSFKICSLNCASQYKEAQRQEKRKSVNETVKSPYKEVIGPWIRKPKYKSPISDAEQLKLNQSIDAKFATKCETKIYKRGSREFKELERLYAN